jgi:hypothetical protein
MAGKAWKTGLSWHMPKAERAAGMFRRPFEPWFAGI